MISVVISLHRHCLLCPAGIATNTNVKPAADDSFVQKWIEGHVLAAAALGKPLLLEEFGNIAHGDAANLTRVRDPLYSTLR